MRAVRFLNRAFNSKPSIPCRTKFTPYTRFFANTTNLDREQKESEVGSSKTEKLSFWEDVRQAVRTPPKSKNDDSSEDEDWRTTLQKSEFGRLWKFTRSEMPLLLRGTAAMGITTTVSMSLPAALGYIIDMATGSTEQTLTLMQVTGGLSGLIVLSGFANFYRIFCFSQAGHSVVRSIRSDLFAAMTRQDMSFYDHTSTGELVTRLSSDTSIMGESLAGLHVATGLRTFVQCIGSFGVMLYLSPELTTVMFAIIPIGGTASVLFGRFVRNTQTRVQDALSDSTAVAEERLGNIRTVRSFAQEQLERNRYHEKVNNIFDLAMLQTKGSGLFFSATNSTGNLFMLGVVGYGAHLVSLGSLSPGILTSFLLYSVYVGMSVVQLSSTFTTIMRGIGASTRVFEILDRVPLIDNENGIVPDHMKGEIEFKNVKFAYPKKDDFSVLRDLNLHVPLGKAVAVVGASGSGKSTIGSLLLRYYDVNAGTIFLDGYDLRSLQPDWLRRHIGVVSQEPVLFSGSIKDNILYGMHPDELQKMSSKQIDDEVVRCAQEANAHEFISQFPDGYDSWVGERGSNLSGGQKQRIAIARALIIDPKILLLDEATSALDAQSEALVAQALERVMSGRTTVVIAHRLSTIKRCDAICVLQDGQIVETGSHDELVSKTDSSYAELVKRQLH